jgi:GT2 family glycosyltransferase
VTSEQGPADGANHASAAVDVLIPTYRRPTALAVTLAGLAAQSHRPLRVVVSDQSEDEPLPSLAPETDTIARVMTSRGIEIERHRHLPRRGMAEHRASLLARARAPYALFLDDDVLVEPDLVARLVAAISRERCGFVGSALVGLSYVGDVRPDEEQIEFWDGPVVPEVVRPGTAEWERYRLHNAANLQHLRQRLGDDERLYRVAWVGGCVLYDTARLREAGGFEFWPSLPSEHAGEDVLAQLRVLAAFGGAGLFPSGAYHLELPTTITDREVDAPRVLPVPTATGAPRR